MPRPVLLPVVLALLLSACAKSIPSYPESDDGLKRMMSDLLAAETKNNREVVERYIRSMVLDDHRRWFLTVFGDERGGVMDDRYADQLTAYDDLMAQAIRTAVAKRRTNVVAYGIDGASDPRATGAQRDAFEAMRTPTRLYTVRLLAPGEDEGTDFWSFVYVHGGFRLVGKMLVPG